jgi:hypothetical protein
MSKEKIAAIISSPTGTFTVDDFESYQKKNDKALWKQFDKWYEQAFHPYHDLWHIYDIKFEHYFKMSDKEFKIYFFNDPSLIEQVSKSYPDVKTPIIGVVQIHTEDKFETCVAPIFQHPNCDIDCWKVKYELNDVSKMITSLVLVDAYGTAPLVLPSVLIHNLKCMYMEVADTNEVKGVYSVLD